jgi:hypothetical protein
MTTDRRSFLKQAAATLVATSLASRPSAASQPAAQGALDDRLLAALGDATLPESLGADGRAAAVDAFRRWVADYHPVAERAHGYGRAEITYTPPDPAPGWNAQLAALDLVARKQHGSGFAELPIETRRTILRTPLEGARLPASPLAATHIAVALLAHWAGSRQAVDLAYNARIGVTSCRPLRDNPRRPLPVTSG